MGFLSNPAINPNPLPNFQPSQIVCLELAGTCLYAEVVQLVASRQLCWVHPLMLISPAPDQWPPDQWDSVNDGLDLRSCSDLLLPWVLFRAAIDTEALPILSDLYDPERPTPAAANQASQQMHQFIHKICQAHPQVFTAIAASTSSDHHK